MKQVLSSLCRQLNEMNKNLMESAFGCNEIGARTRTVMARHQLEMLESCLEAGTRQVQAAVESSGPRELISKQTGLAAEFSEKFVGMTQEIFEIQNQARVELSLCVEDGLNAVRFRSFDAEFIEEAA